MFCSGASGGGKKGELSGQSQPVFASAGCDWLLDEASGQRREAAFMFGLLSYFCWSLKTRSSDCHQSCFPAGRDVVSLLLSGRLFCGNVVFLHDRRVDVMRRSL